MAGFTDSKDRTWSVRITPYTIRQAKDFCGINLGTILQDQMRPLQKLLDDPADLCSVIYAICQDEANAKNIDLKSFMEGIVGDPIEDAAEALLEGLQEFFPSIQRAQVTALITLSQQKKKKSTQQVEKYLNDLTYLTTHSPWQRLRAWIRGTIPQRS